MATPDPTRPSWDQLFEFAVCQAGCFTTQQAAHAGYSTQLLGKHIKAGRIRRIQRGIYRLVHYPLDEDEDMVITWLWSDHEGVFSHHTALMLQRLSDVFPARVFLTLPAVWEKRRLRVPPGLILHFADIAPEDRGWFGAVPITRPRRTLNDAAIAGLSPDLLKQGALQAIQRGLVRREDLPDVQRALEPFGGL